MRWRWDQGRLHYFRYENVVKLAAALESLDGVALGNGPDLLRAPLTSATELPFLPVRYKVWRNYARVFECALLATRVNGRLVTTDLCRKMAEAPALYPPDEYLNFVFSHFALPFPAFDDYNATIAPTFPFVAIIKFAISAGPAGISLADVFSRVIGNDCTGLEPLDHYRGLLATSRKPLGDEKRQVREMLVFMGQSSFLKWFDGRLYIDSAAEDINVILKAVAPVLRPKRSGIPEEEFLAIATVGRADVALRRDVTLKDRESPQLSFQEGGRIFGTHGKIERSPLVRRKFFEIHPDTICNACNMNTKVRYPWTDNILELHHVLPLAASLNANGTTTLLDDLVALCPSCHKSIHVFYRIKLREWGIEDFGSKKMALDVYEMAKREIVV